MIRYLYLRWRCYLDDVCWKHGPKKDGLCWPCHYDSVPAEPHEVVTERLRIEYKERKARGPHHGMSRF